MGSQDGPDSAASRLLALFTYNEVSLGMRRLLGVFVPYLC